MSTEELDGEGSYLLDHLRISVVVYVIASLGSLGYLAGTLERPHRPLIATLAIVACVAALGIVHPLRERIIRSPHRDRLLYGWSALTYGFVVAVTFLDGGLRSPFFVLILLSMQYVAMAYPIAGVVAFSVAADVAVIALGVARPGGTSPAHTAMMLLIVGIAGLLGTLAARNRLAQQARQEELHAQMAELANLDPLTGSLNRRRFDEVMSQELARAVRHDRHLSLLVLDIDGFKAINDTHGHPVGDAALRALADVLRTESRAHDVVARLGGDEFAVVLPDTDPSEAEVLAGRIASAVAAIADPLPIVTSIGVAGGPARLVDAEQLVCVADASLYRAKAAGRQSQAASSMPATMARTTVPPPGSASGHPTFTATTPASLPASGQ